MNAFERLIDRSLFAGLGFENSTESPGDTQEASNSWTLLQALLRQNEQARNYTQKLLLKKAQEQPGIRPRSIERLQALLELWPIAERDVLFSAFGVAQVMSQPVTAGVAGASEPSTGLHVSAGHATPPRRQSHTPDWGEPMFSESPALPGSRRGQERGYGHLEDSAVTVQIRNSRDQVGDSATTLASKRQGTSNSLDAWLQPQSIGSGDLTSQMRRTKSLPATGAPIPTATSRSWAPQLVLDFGPSGSSEDDRAITAQLRPQVMQPMLPVPREEAAVTRMPTSMPNPSMGGKSREAPVENRFPSRRSTGLAGVSSGSSGAEPSRRRAASLPQRHLLPNAPASESEDEVTLDPETLKQARKKANSRASSKRMSILSEARNEESGDEKRRSDRRFDEVAFEKLQAKVKMAEAAAVEAEAKLSQAVAEAKTFAISKETAEAQVLALTAQLHVVTEAKGEAEAQRALALSEARIAVQAKEAAEATVAVALNEAKVALKMKEEAESHATAAIGQADASAKEKEEAEAELEAAVLKVQKMIDAKETAEARSLSAVAEAKAAKEAKEAMEARAASVAQQAEVAVHARQAAEAKSKANSEALALSEQRLSQALQQASEAKGAADAWAAEASEAAKRAKGKEAAHQRLASRCAEAQPRWLVQVLRGAGMVSMRWAFQKLLQHCGDLRHEQRLGLAVATKVQCLQHEHQLVLDSVRVQLEERLQDMSTQREELLHQTAKSMARELQMASSLSQKQQLFDAFGAWRAMLRRTTSAKRLERVLRKHWQRRHLQLWRRQAEVDLLSYLEVQIDCFDAFTTKRTALCWRVLRRAGGYWTSEHQDLALLALLAAWRRCTEETHWQQQRRSWGARKLADVGIRLLRRHLWAPWLSWQQAEQESLTAAMRQVEESHAREEADRLKRELEEMRLQALSQQNTLAVELAALQQGQRQLEQTCDVKSTVFVHRSWHLLAQELRTGHLRALLRAMQQRPHEGQRRQALEASWRCLVSMLLAQTPWRERSGATCCAVDLVRQKRQEAAELLRQRRPLARLVAFGAALRQRELRRGAVQTEKVLRSVFHAFGVLQRLASIVPRVAQRWAFRRLQQQVLLAQQEAQKAERWEVMLQSWQQSSALKAAKEAQRSTAIQFLVQLLMAHERHSCRMALQGWRNSALLHEVQVEAERRVAAHCDSKQELRMRQGLSILTAVVKNRMQLALSQAMLGQWRILRWQAKVGSLDASVAREHRRMMAETELLRSQLVQSRDEALELRAEQAKEAQEALQMTLQAEANLQMLKQDCAAQAEKLLTLEDTKVLTEQRYEKLKQRQHQAKARRESFHHYQVKDWHKRVIFNTWLRTSREHVALEAKKTCATHLLLQSLALLQRQICEKALHRWRGSAMARAVEVVSQKALAEQYDLQRELRLRHAVLMLDQLVRSRLQQALLGHWRVLRWQAMVRSLDSSFARDQRRMLAEADSLRSQLVQSHDEALELRALKASESQKALRTRQEAEAIVEAVKKERANQAAKLHEMETSKKSVEQLCEKLREQLDQATSEVTHLDAEKRSAMQQLCTLQSDLENAQQQREDLMQAEMQRERAYHEQVQLLQQRAVKREAELQETSQKSEKALELKLQQKQRAVELQTSIAEDQEKNIRHLEDLLKEQNDVLSRERNDHQRGLNALRASASLSESKTSLLQEQVVALRQQLQREHQELIASERAWSSDRAALLSAVSNPPEKTALPPSGKRSTARRKASPSSPKPGATRCPWHGPHGSKKLAPALM